METVMLLVAFILLLFVVYTTIRDDRRDEKRCKALAADIKAHPEKYYEYDGGTIPNPPPEPTVETPPETPPETPTEQTER